MAYSAEVITDSISEAGDRLTTLEVTFPRIVLAEFNTHRMLSRNSASSRAIPLDKQLRMILDDTFLPVYWGINQPGMQAKAELSPEEIPDAEAIWLHTRDQAILGAVALFGGTGAFKDEALKERLIDLQDQYSFTAPTMRTPVHKQLANRLLEPFMWHTVVTSATDWSNFFALRANPEAQPEIERIASLMQAAYRSSTPAELGQGEWHLPFVQPTEREMAADMLKKMATARCARVSYLTHDTGRVDIGKDISLHDSLRGNGHMSPFEHVARPMTPQEREKYLVWVGDTQAPYSGNFRGYMQYRKEIPHEHDFGAASARHSIGG